MLELVLAVHDRLAALAEHGVPVSLLESLDLGELERAGRETLPDAADEVRGIGGHTLSLIASETADSS